MALEVKIKARHIVKPAEKTFTGTMKLSDLDMAAAKAYIPKLYLYKPNKHWDSNSISQTLIDSLAKVLVHFYPFAGRLRLIVGGGGRVVLDVDDTADTWGVQVFEADADVDLPVDLPEAEANGTINNLFSIVDSDKPLDELPLLSVLITHFRCGGVAVGITWSHAVVDGIGAGHFYTEWTRIARGESLEMEPVHDRNFLSDWESSKPLPEFIKRVTLPPPTPMVSSSTDGSKVDVSAKSPSKTVFVKLFVSKFQINKLKQIAGNVKNGRPYSRFEVLTAHTWRCASKARGHNGTKLNGFGMPMDIRKRINPPLPRAYNGNAIIVMAATSVTEDLISNPLGYACDKIRQTIDKTTNEFIWELLGYQKSLKDSGERHGITTPEGTFVNHLDVLMTSWMNLSFNNLDFGWGNEAYMAWAPAWWEGVGCVMSGQEEGSAIVVLSLQVGHVDKFKDYFFHELDYTEASVYSIQARSNHFTST